MMTDKQSSGGRGRRHQRGMAGTHPEINGQGRLPPSIHPSIWGVAVFFSAEARCLCLLGHLGRVVKVIGFGCLSPIPVGRVLGCWLL